MTNEVNSTAHDLPDLVYTPSISSSLPNGKALPEFACNSCWNIDVLHLQWHVMVLRSTDIEQCYVSRAGLSM